MKSRIPINEQLGSFPVPFLARALKFALTLAVLAAGLPAQSRSDSIAPGKLLVASPSLPDPGFAETVILIVQTGSAGVTGLVVNRASDFPLVRLFPKAAPPDSRVYLGGPLNFGVRALRDSKAKLAGAAHLVDDVYLLADRPSVEAAASRGLASSVFRVYAGYAGWTEDQLAGEIGHGYWQVRAAAASQIFDENPRTLWSRLAATKIAVIWPGIQEWLAWPERP